MMRAVATRRRRAAGLDELASPSATAPDAAHDAGDGHPAERSTSSMIMNRIDVVSPNDGLEPTACFGEHVARMTSRATRSGKARKRSVTRIRMSSSLPPVKPAKAPTMVPMMLADDGRRRCR